ncbi:amidohydrolase family protein [Clostridiaceae bacterium M8S5]|nr:amidohydrolase family protein [Clostridiaceae bacterium M8S5]
MKDYKGNELIINNINILTMVNNKILKNKLVVIKDGRIIEIGKGTDNTGNYLNVIDGKDKYIMPGLINMHTHLGDNKDDLKLYLANGITTIRNMWGYGKFNFGQWLFGTRVFNHLLLKKQIDERKIIGPTIFTAGPLLDGKDPFFPKFMNLHALKDKKQINQVIKNQFTKGYDFIKIYSKISKQNFKDIINIAKLYDMPVVGHVPDSVGIRQALKSKMHSIEHLYGFFNPYMPELNLKKEEIKEIASIAASNDVWNCPTLIANERIANIDRKDEFENEDQMSYISNKNKKAMRFLLRKSNELIMKNNIKGNHEYMEFLFYIIQQLKNEGAGILMGTDKAVPYVVAGFSEHKEMKLLKEAGLDNYEVIKTATINAAKCLKIEKDVGTIGVGKKANIIITNKNPLVDLNEIYKHNGVIKEGIYYSRAKCNKILEEIKVNLR